MSTRRPYLEEISALWRLAAPLALAQAGTQVMALVDTAVVGRLGAAPLGGAGLGHALFFAAGVVGMGVMMGLDPLIAQAIGSGDQRRARHLVWQGVWLAIAVGGVLTLPLAGVIPFLENLGIQPEVAAQARAFILVRLLGLIPLLLFIGLRSYLQAIGVTWPMVVAMVLANVFNAALAVLLVFGGASLPEWAGPLRAAPRMGVAGAAVATTVAAVVQVVVLALALVSLREEKPASRRPVASDLGRAFRIGLPAGLQMGAEVGVFTLVAFLAGGLSTEALAAHEVALTLAGFTFTVALGVSAAGSVRVGQAIGAGDAAATRRAGIVAFAGGIAVMALPALTFALFPGTVARVLTDEPAVIAATVPLLMVAAVFQLSDGTQAVGAGVLRGAGDTRFAFVANLLGHYAIGLPIAILLGLKYGLGVTGLWWGLCAGLTTVGITLFARFLRLSSRPIAPLEHHPERAG